MRNPLKRRPDAEPKPTLRERAAALKATAGRVMRRTKPPSSAEAVAAMAPHHPGMVPYPPAAPTHLLEVDLTIRLEAARLLELADAEFDRRYDELTEGLDEAERETAADQLQRELRIRALAEAAADTNPTPPIDWHKPPAGYMASPAIEPFGFFNIAEALPLEAVRLHELAQAEFERRRAAFRPDVVGPSEADWSASLRRMLRLDAWAAVASPERAEPAGDDLSEPGFVLFEDTAGMTRRKPVADWIAYMATRLLHVARDEEARAFNAAPADEQDRDADALSARLRRDLRIDALFDLAFRSREVFEASRGYAVGDRWQHGRGDATDLDAELLALEAEFLAAHRAVEDAYAAYALAGDAYENPPVPRELRIWRNDWIIKSLPRPHTQTLKTVGSKAVLVTHYGAEEVAHLRGVRCLRPSYGTAGELQPDGTRALPDAKAQERADAIVAAWDRWQAEIAAAKEAASLPALIAAHEAAQDRRAPILERLRGTPAGSLAGLGVKARIAVALDGDADLKRTGREEYDAEDPQAFIYDLAGDALALTAAPTARV
ncbi:hypothetical protein MKK68_03790 [Methylobacterium sp. E-016]|uniref:hypothetical protein n=1 Tax=Methylobacterium sp. E-016 TaxID=2836556 RepID=UPI001FBA93DB|nr:hypothetical protein [Methylobacterium sp. E-016]MCJ2074774.1 hypothetical protein [Methylobacterium sp. E-016]